MDTIEQIKVDLAEADQLWAQRKALHRILGLLGVNNTAVDYECRALRERGDALIKHAFVLMDAMDGKE